MTDISVTVEDAQPINVQTEEVTVNTTFEGGVVSGGTGKVKISSDDDIGNFLEIKLQAGAGIELQKTSTGSDEVLTIINTDANPTWGDIDGTLSDQTDLQNALDEKEPSLPETPENPETKYLNGNREWKAVAIGAGGFAGNLYFTTLDSDVSGYKVISYDNQETETELSGTIVNQEVLFRTYLFDKGIDTDIIDAGVWVANYRAKVSGTQGVSQLKMEVFLRHSDNTETTLWSDYSPELNNTDYVTIRSEYNAPSFECETTDRLGVRIYAKTTANNAITFYTIIGDGDASYFTTPLRIRHNQLRALNDDENYQHIDATDRTNLDNFGNLVPYTGATQDVDLGNNKITADKLLLSNEFVIERISPEIGSGTDTTLTNKEGSVEQRIRFIDGSSGLGKISFDFSNNGFSSFTRSMTINQDGNIDVLGNITASNLSGTNTGDQDLSGLVPYTGATADVELGDNSLVLSDGSEGIKFYNSSDEETNYGLLKTWWDGTRFNIGDLSAGTENVKPIRIGIGKSTGATTLGRYLDIGGGNDARFTFSDSTGATNTGIGVVGNLSASGGIQKGIQVLNTIVQSGTAGFDAITTDITETSKGSGDYNLLNLKVDGSTKLLVDDTGTTTLYGIASYNEDKTFTDDKQLIAKKYVDDAIVQAIDDSWAGAY